MHFFLNRNGKKWKTMENNGKQWKAMEGNGKFFAKDGKKNENTSKTSFSSLFKQPSEMNSIQLPTNIALNIWEDSIKMEADAIIRKIHKMKYDDVLRQLKYIIPLEEDDEWYYGNFCSNTIPTYRYVIPLLMDPEEREVDYDNEYFYCRVSQAIELDPPSYRTGRYHLTRGLVFDVYDYDTDNNKNDEDLKEIKDRIASILQKSINIVEEDDSDYEYEDDFFDY
jgi:hypothetical protein